MPDGFCAFLTIGFNEAGAILLRKSRKLIRSGRLPAKASMRPEQFCSGNRDSSALFTFIMGASMRPEQFCSGNRINVCHFVVIVICFNEAGAILLRKSGFRGESVEPPGRFNEAGAILLRKSLSCLSRDMRITCFNEAGAILLRKSSYVRCSPTKSGSFNEAGAILLRKSWCPIN